MRALLLFVFLAACRAAPAWEPLGGFELAPATGPWRGLEPRELERWLAGARAGLAPIRDYTATLETRERIGDELHPRRVLLVKLREQPFAAAAESLEPSSEAGQRVWYDGAKGRKLLAETPGLLGKLVGRVALDPTGALALENRRHPITDLGLTRLLEQVEAELVPALARRSPPRLRTTEALLGSTRLLVVDALVPREPPDPPLVHRLGFEADSGLLSYYGQAELLPDGLALVEEYAYGDLSLNPGLGEECFRPEE